MTLWLSSAAPQPSALAAFYLRPTSNSIHSTDLFQWPVATDIDAVLKLNVASAASAQVLIIIYSGPDILVKFKSKYQLAAGAQELRIPKVFATDKIIGQRLLTAKLELAVKGYATETREVTFEVKGPPQPKAEITSMKIYAPTNAGTPSTPKALTQFGLGQPFMVQVNLDVTDNPAKLKAQLIVLASMKEDDQYTGYDLEHQTYDDHYDIKQLDLDEGEGPQRVVLRGSLPRFFGDPWDNHHPFTIYAALDFGGERIVKSIEAEVFDYSPGETRRQDDPARRLINIARASSWAVSLPEPEPQPVPVQ